MDDSRAKPLPLAVPNPRAFAAGALLRFPDVVERARRAPCPLRVLASADDVARELGTTAAAVRADETRALAKLAALDEMRELRDLGSMGPVFVRDEEEDERLEAGDDVVETGEPFDVDGFVDLDDEGL